MTDWALRVGECTVDAVTLSSSLRSSTSVATADRQLLAIGSAREVLGRRRINRISVTCANRVRRISLARGMLSRLLRLTRIISRRETPPGACRIAPTTVTSTCTLAWTTASHQTTPTSSRRPRLSWLQVSVRRRGRHLRRFLSRRRREFLPRRLSWLSMCEDEQS